MTKAPTQDFLEIREIRDGILILKNKTLRGILIVSSTNFALKSEDEQKAVILQFQNFLNSLDFSLEIAVQSRKLNITGYLEKLKDLEKSQENELLRAQTAEYRKFIQKLIQRSSIMSKNFLVVIPLVPTEVKTPSEPKGLIKKPSIPKLTEEAFQRAKVQLKQRMEFVALGLRRCGLECAILDSSEAIELLWSVYHPKRAELGYYPEIPPEVIK